METGFRFKNWTRKLVSVSNIGNEKMETRENYPPCPDAAKLQDEAALSPPFQIWLSGRPTLLGVTSIISSWYWEGREGSTYATIVPPPFHDETALSPPFQIWLSGRPTLLGVASIISSWCWEGREPECSTCATIAPPFHNEAALSPHFQIWLSGRPTLLGVASIISS